MAGSGAEREYDAVLRLDPDNASAREGRSVLLMTLGRFAEALDEAERAVRLEPAPAGVRHTYATALTFSGRLDDAAASERVALALSPNYVIPYVWLGEIAAIRRDFVTMGNEFQHVPHLTEVGRALVAMSASPAAKPAVLRAIGAIKSPNPGLDAARKGWLYAAGGEVDLSLSEFETALSICASAAVRFPTVQRALGSSPRYQAMLRTLGVAR